MDLETFKCFSLFKDDFMYKKRYIGCDTKMYKKRATDYWVRKSHHYVLAHNILYKITTVVNFYRDTCRAEYVDFQVEEVRRRQKLRVHDINNEIDPHIDFMLNKVNVFLTDEDYYDLLVRAEMFQYSSNDMYDFIQSMRRGTYNNEYMYIINMVYENTKDGDR